LCGRNRERLQTVAKSLGIARSEYQVISSDIRRTIGMNKIVNAAVRRFGRIDIFVNNAGVGAQKSIVDLSEQEFDTIFATNVRAVFISLKLLIPQMQKQGEGQIINISSGAGRIGIPGIAAYSASKAALNALGEAVGGEVRNDAIKICTLAPGSTDTRFVSNMASRPKEASKKKQKLTADEVAEAVIFLAKQNSNAWTSMADLRPLLINR